ncbi:DNA polymerase III subunit gamma/tau [Niabella ginsengisoli]|uniref:DNA polymerase III subunit gamma/tau n=1 Tax=Niabella ginsengisoli TaxID=522298 RepID=A0ABS9SK03_9BACT|nr:DNA polymerase III subunit gamma/tau [Niabella ginsengisoli]MCH5598519.1 DNA polymerase III subunit gamma/tau [Niabella ginsengisoli]
MLHLSRGVIMDKFIVSARKYRPQNFDTVVGQQHITTTLKNAIKQNQLAHAFLFCGPRGVGKTTCARILAKTINCESQTPDGEACNQCQSCVSFNHGSSLNIHELDAASNNSVDDIRTLVDQVRFAPQAGRYKVYIIDEVHMLSSAAFNAFLKTLEEPPPYAIFILATTEKHKILPTILSRCQIFDFKRITTNDTVEHLEDICKKESVNADKASLQLIAQKSEGCMRDALSIMDKIVSFSNGEISYNNTLEHLNILDEDYYFRLMDFMQQQDLSSAMLLYEDINRKGFEGDLVLNGMASFIRNLLVSRDEKVVALLDTVESFKEKYISTAKQVSAPLLISALNVLNESEINYRSARNKRLHVELTLIKLCYLQQAMQITLDENSVSKKKLTESKGALAFRQIQPVAIKPIAPKTKSTNTQAPAAKLTISEEPPAKHVETPVTVATPPPTTEARLAETKTAGGKKISSLEKLRKQFKQIEPEKEDIPLEETAVLEAWKKFTQVLKDNRNPAAQSFSLATVKIVDANSFYVYTSNPLENRFVEITKNEAAEFLKEALQNSQLQIFNVINPNRQVQEETIEKPLTAVDQYKKMIEKYPLVQQLKEKLKLELGR